MTHIIRVMIVVVVVGGCILSTAFAQQTIIIQFPNKVGNDLLQLGTMYKNPFDESMLVIRYK